MDISTQIGIKIKEMRTVQNITQEELAKGIVNRSFISQLEKGTVSPSIDTLDKLAQRLNCSISYLIGQSERNEAIDQLNIISLMDNIESHLNENSLDRAKQLLESITGEWMSKLSNFERGKYFWIKARINWFDKNYEDAELYVLKAIKIYEDNYQNQLGKLYNFLGTTLFKLDKIEDSFKSFSKAMYFTHQYPSDYYLTVETYFNMGVYHTYLREYQTAIYYLLNAQECGENNSTLHKLGEIKMTLGICYRHIGRLQESIAAYLDASRLFTTRDENNHLAGVYFNLGVLYREINDMNESTNCFTKAKTTYEQKKNESYIHKCEIQLIKNMIKSNSTQLARESFKELRKKGKKIGYEDALLGGIINLTEYKTTKNETVLSEGINYFSLAGEIVKSSPEHKLDYLKDINTYILQENFFEEAKALFLKYL
ncbi:tetratricopeptide repeat protein [Fictibacillus aquaticus]|uniref:HTH cro/C1-type domain-containing protein n=1 Tax=Fictibacillus aquaticus TaxID=2021314 RepID=A0A235F602_9BACL|nr:helix-turn-helix transcriptional regulator [Fictibacillus aquaticus]OYD56604.1 hypothetical protein CGZ90_16460 [Fictibacillus aquaticus]